MTKESFCLFSHQFSAYLRAVSGDTERPVLLIADGAGAHQRSICEAAGLRLQTLPAACAELNVVERFFEELRKELANHIFDTIENLEDYLCSILAKYFDNPSRITKLTRFPYTIQPN